MAIAWRKPVATIAATLAAATTPTAILASLVYVELPPELFGEFLFIILVLFLFALGHVLVFGLPVAGWLLRFERLRVLPVAVAGAIVGALPYGVFALVDPLHGGRCPHWRTGTQQAWTIFQRQLGELLAKGRIVGGIKLSALLILGSFRAFFSSLVL